MGFVGREAEVAGGGEGHVVDRRGHERETGAPGRLRLAVCYATIAACVPYLTLKVLWLFGSTAGATDAAAAAELLDPRHIVGDVVTAGMELVAIALVLALTYRWGRRLPAVLVLAPIWTATGLLAPIAVGLPLGLVAQAFLGGSPAPTGTGLHGWVYALVYGGFIAQAVGLLAAFIGYARTRWPEVFRLRAARRRVVAPRQRAVAAVAAVIATGYAAMLVVWSISGPGAGGPAGFDTVSQRTFLLAQGLVVAVGVTAALSLVRRRDEGRALPRLALAWIGTGVLVTSGPTHIALSNHGTVSLVFVSASLAGTVCGLLLTLTSGLAVLTNGRPGGGRAPLPAPADSPESPRQSEADYSIASARPYSADSPEWTG